MFFHTYGFGFYLILPTLARIQEAFYVHTRLKLGGGKCKVASNVSYYRDFESSIIECLF